MHEHDVVNKLQRSNNMFVTFRSPKGDTNKKDWTQLYLLFLFT